MKRKSDIVFTVVAALLLVVLLGGMIIQPQKKASYYENRRLAEFPEAEQTAVLDGSWFTKLETYLSDHSFLRAKIQPAATWLNLNLFRRPVVNDVVIGDDVLLPYWQHEAVDGIRLRRQAEALADNLETLSDLVESYGGTYCYAGVPCQYAFFEDAYPDYLNNRSEYTDASNAVLAEVLAERGVNYLDLGPVFDELGSPELFSSRVDNHYSIFGAYAVYRNMLAELNRLAAAKAGGGWYKALPIVAEKDLVFEPVDAYYIGSRNRRLFNLITSEEKLYTAEPVNPVPFTRWDYGHTDPDPTRVYVYPKEGKAADYDFYMGGNVSITRIETKRPSLPNVLIYGDSFTNAVECILYLSCNTMHSVDMRYYHDSTLSEVIEKEKPDYVFCIRDYEALLSTEANGRI